MQVKSQPWKKILTIIEKLSYETELVATARDKTLLFFREQKLCCVHQMKFFSNFKPTHKNILQLSFKGGHLIDSGLSPS